MVGFVKSSKSFQLTRVENFIFHCKKFIRKIRKMFKISKQSGYKLLAAKHDLQFLCTGGINLQELCV